ncbi:MAG: tryptophan 2,3-dioxygenase [Candidatus Kapabacteria bacterium]|nr:tryptophan 2,3-dioxygenase [Candidatus Kapabacteria bacterium]
MTSHGVYYADYLQLNKILNAQELESDKHNKHAHDEMLFIIVHQAFELWFKQILFEVNEVINILDQDYVPEASIGKALARVQRVNKIFEMFPQQFAILETMTPREFMEFRDFLYPASGFQSYQFRLAEIRMGLADSRRLELDTKGFIDRLGDEARDHVNEARKLPSLFSVLEKWLEKMPFMETDGYAFWEAYRNVVKNIFDHDRVELHKVTSLTPEQVEKQLKQIAGVEQGFEALFNADTYKGLQESGERRLSQRASLAALFISVYSEYPLLQTPYRFLDAVLEMDKLISVFRYRHTVMVSRMIGQRVGTGGSSGFDYLLKTVTQHRVFTDIAGLSSYLLPSHQIPVLPEEISKKLQFVAEA